MPSTSRYFSVKCESLHPPIRSVARSPSLLRRRPPGTAQDPPHRLPAQFHAFHFPLLLRQMRIVESAVLPPRPPAQFHAFPFPLLLRQMRIVESAVLASRQLQHLDPHPLRGPPRPGLASIPMSHPVYFARLAALLHPLDLPRTQAQQLGCLRHRDVTRNRVLNHLHPLQLSLAQFDHPFSLPEVTEFRRS